MASRKLGSVKLTDTIGLTPLAASDIGGGTPAQFLRGDGAWSNTLTGGLNLGGALLASTDNAYDIGALAATRFRNLYMSGNGLFSGAIGVGTTPNVAAGSLTLAGTLFFTPAAGKIVPGATSLSLRNNADSADNLLITNAGVVTTRSDLNALGGLNVGPSASGAAAGQVFTGGHILFTLGNTGLYFLNTTGTAGYIQRDSASGDLIIQAQTVVKVPTGINLGSASGAAAGEIRASGAGAFAGKVTAAQPSARVTHSTTQSVATATVTALAFNGEDFDTDSIHDTATNNSRLTCKTAGKYLVACDMDWGTVTGGNRRLTAIYKNGATIMGQVENPPPASASQFLSQSLAKIVNLAVNDYLEMRVFQDSGGSYTVPATNNGIPDFAMAYLGT